MTQRIPVAPYPTGWYVLSPSEALAPGQVVSTRFMGEDLVLFRTAAGAPGLADAYCPHMGAHFGHGGTVVGETLRCPFHGFCFDRAGTCVSTPYGHAPPAAARLRMWHVQEKNGFVLGWYTRDGAAPVWEVPEVDATGGWTPLRHHTYTLHSHPQETTENSVDIGHLMVVHGYKDLEQLSELRTEGPYLNVRYAMKRNADVFGSRGRWFRAEFEIHIHGLGWSFVEVVVPELGVRSRHYVLPTPLDEDRMQLRIALAIQPVAEPRRVSPFLSLLPRSLTTWIVGEMTFRGYVHDVTQDVPIWENKRYIHPPALAKGDGPVGRYRQWARQFYAEDRRL